MGRARGRVAKGEELIPPGGLMSCDFLVVRKVVNLLCES